MDKLEKNVAYHSSAVWITFARISEACASLQIAGKVAGALDQILL